MSFACRFALAPASAIALATFATLAQAQTYPAQDIHLISAFPPGSGADILVRYFAEKLRPLAGRTILVENKAGAGGNIATEYVARAKPDGHTIFVHAGNTLASNFHLIRNNPLMRASRFRSPPPSIGRRSCLLSTPSAHGRLWPN